MQNDSMKHVQIKTHSLENFRQLLKKYLQLNILVSKEWDWQDVPWRYNERPNLGLLAAAAWKINGIAFEEYNFKKRHRRNLPNRKTIYRGRNDLYIKLGSKEYLIEAKKFLVKGFHNPSKSLNQIENMFANAIRDAKKNKYKYRIQVAALFISPRFILTDAECQDNHIHKWIAFLSKINYSAAAWIFPSKTKTSPVRHKTHKYPGHVYPGVVLLLKFIK